MRISVAGDGDHFGWAEELLRVRARRDTRSELLDLMGIDPACVRATEREDQRCHSSRISHRFSSDCWLAGLAGNRLGPIGGILSHEESARARCGR